MARDNDVTGWLVAWGQGDRAANSRLMAAVYKRPASCGPAPACVLRGLTILSIPTALVHEAYLRLVDLRRVQWQNRAQFFAVAARLMRQILIDHARAHMAGKRGGASWRVPLTDDRATTAPRDVDLLDLDGALEKLAAADAGLGDLVVLRFFGGLTVEEVAEVRAVSVATVKRDWARARAWLFRELQPAGAPRS